MRWVRWLGCGLLLAGVIGCGGGDRLVVTGTVTLDDKPLPDAVVTFHPDGTTEGKGGSGRTGPDGKYTLTAAGGASLPPGAYKVVVSRPLRPNGEPPDPNVPPIESDAHETLPASYSSLSATTLTVTVSKEATVHDFPLRSQPSKPK
jgi:hypothetical protein